MSTTIVEIRVDKIPPYIQGLLGCWKSDYIKAYILIPEKWVKIEGYEVMLTHKRSTKVFVKYPPTTKVSRIKTFLVPTERSSSRRFLQNSIRQNRYTGMERRRNFYGLFRGASDENGLRDSQIQNSVSKKTLFFVIYAKKESRKVCVLVKCSDESKD